MSVSKFKLGLSSFIMIALVGGVLFGLFFKSESATIAPIGDIFVSLLKMVVVPLVFFSITHGASMIGGSSNAGKYGFGILLYFGITTLLAATMGVAMAEVFGIGKGLNIPVEFNNGTEMFASEVAASKQGGGSGFFGFLMSIIPQNPFAALQNGAMLPIIFFALFFGFGMGSVKEENKLALRSTIEGAMEVCVWITEQVMKLAPIGVFALVAFATATFGIDLLLLVVKFFAVFVGLSLIFVYGVLGLLVVIFSKYSYIKFFKAMTSAQIFAFASASSAATLPITVKGLKTLGVKDSVISFTVPLGATVNMNGVSMFYSMLCVFFAQLYNIDLSMAQYITIITLSSIAAMGVAGVPGLNLLVVAVLVAANIPLHALPLMIGVDRIFDMVRTSVNVLGDASCAAILDRFDDKDNSSANT